MLHACAAACRLCADECEKHAKMHEHCRICAESCRRCVSACEEAGRGMAHYATVVASTFVAGGAASVAGFEDSGHSTVAIRVLRDVRSRARTNWLPPAYIPLGYRPEFSDASSPPIVMRSGGEHAAGI
jgi:hypothetical protein